MQIGDLSRPRTSQRLHQNPIVQAMSLVLMVGFMLAGWMAFSASGHETTPAPQKEAAIAPPVEAATSQGDVAPQAVSPRKVADAGSSIPLDLLAPPVPSAQPEAVAPPEPEQVQASLGPSVAPAPEAPAAPAAPAQSDTTGAVSVQANATPPAEPSEDIVDLNSASFETLNTIPGAGPVGRAIIKGRPYASAEDLVTKKVLRRSIYEKIKDRVTAR